MRLVKAFMIALSGLVVVAAVWASFERYGNASFEQIEANVRDKLLTDLKFLQRATSKSPHLGHHLSVAIAGKVGASVAGISPETRLASAAEILAEHAGKYSDRFSWGVFDFIARRADGSRTFKGGDELELVFSSDPAEPELFEAIRYLAIKGVAILTDNSLDDDFKTAVDKKLWQVLDERNSGEQTKFLSSSIRSFQSCTIKGRQHYLMWLPVYADDWLENPEKLKTATLDESASRDKRPFNLAGVVAVVYDEENFRLAGQERFLKALNDNFRRSGCRLAFAPEHAGEKWIADKAYLLDPALQKTLGQRMRGVTRAGNWLRTEIAVPALQNRLIVLARHLGAERPSVKLIRKAVFTLLTFWMAMIIYFCGNHIAMDRKIAFGLRSQLAMLVIAFSMPAFLVAFISMERYLNSTQNATLQRLRTSSQESLTAFDNSIRLYRTRMCSLADALIQRGSDNRAGLAGQPAWTLADRERWLGGVLDIFLERGIVMKNILHVDKNGEIVSRLAGGNRSEEKFFHEFCASIFLPALNIMSPGPGDKNDDELLMKAQAEEVLETMRNVLLPDLFPAIGHTFSSLSHVEGLGDRAFLYHRFTGHGKSVDGAMMMALFAPSLECIAFNQWVENYQDEYRNTFWLIVLKSSPGWFLKAPFGKVFTGGKFGLLRFMYELLPQDISFISQMATLNDEAVVSEISWSGRRWLFATTPGNNLIDYQLTVLMPLDEHYRDYSRFKFRLRLAMLAIFAICSLIGWRLASGFVLPVRRFAETSERLMEGDFSVRLEEDWADDEFRMIAEEFNQIAADVETGRILRKFVSSGALESIAADDKLDRTKALKSTQAVVMFFKLEGFWEATRQKEPAQAVAELNRFFSYVCSAVRVAGGEVSKFIGEKAMTTFFVDAASLSGERSYAAVTAAIAILNRLQRHRMISSSCRVRIGIATGLVRSGIIGAEDTRLEQTVIGDVVNLAARLCSHECESNILMCGNTASAVVEACSRHSGEMIKLEKLPPQLIKGKKQAVEVYAVSDIMYNA